MVVAVKNYPFILPSQSEVGSLSDTSFVFSTATISISSEESFILSEKILSTTGSLLFDLLEVLNEEAFLETKGRIILLVEEVLSFLLENFTANYTIFFHNFEDCDFNDGYIGNLRYIILLDEEIPFISTLYNFYGETLNEILISEDSSTNFFLKRIIELLEENLTQKIDDILLKVSFYNEEQILTFLDIIKIFSIIKPFINNEINILYHTAVVINVVIKFLDNHGFSFLEISNADSKISTTNKLLMIYNVQDHSFFNRQLNISDFINIYNKNEFYFIIFRYINIKYNIFLYLKNIFSFNIFNNFNFSLFLESIVKLYFYVLSNNICSFIDKNLILLNIGNIIPINIYLNDKNIFSFKTKILINIDFILTFFYIILYRINNKDNIQFFENEVSNFVLKYILPFVFTLRSLSYYILDYFNDLNEVLIIKDKFKFNLNILEKIYVVLLEILVFIIKNKLFINFLNLKEKLSSNCFIHQTIFDFIFYLGELLLEDDIFNVYTINIDNLNVSTYKNFEFISAAQCKGNKNVYILKDGIYEKASPNNLSFKLESDYITPSPNNEINIIRGYLYCKANKPFYLHTISEGKEGIQEAIYKITPNKPGHFETHIVELSHKPKGLRWKFILEGENMNEFELKKCTIIPVVLVKR